MRPRYTGQIRFLLLTLLLAVVTGTFIACGGGGNAFDGVVGDTSTGGVGSDTSAGGVGSDTSAGGAGGGTSAGGAGGGTSAGGVGSDTSAGGAGGGTSTGPVTFKVNGESVSMQGVFTIFKQPSGRQTPSLEAQGSGRWKRLYIDMFYDWPPPTIPYDASSSQPGIGLLDNQDNEYESTTPSSYSFVIESVSGNRVKGTFSFQLGSRITVTDGRFDVPLEFKDAP